MGTMSSQQTISNGKVVPIDEQPLASRVGTPAGTPIDGPSLASPGLRSQSPRSPSRDQMAGGTLYVPGSGQSQAMRQSHSQNDQQGYAIELSEKQQPQGPGSPQIPQDAQRYSEDSFRTAPLASPPVQNTATVPSTYTINYSCPLRPNSPYHRHAVLAAARASS